MKVVRQISTGRLVFRQEPDFEPSKGVLSVSRNSGIPETDLQEVDVMPADWDAELILRTNEEKERQLNKPEMKALIEVIEDTLSVARRTLRDRVKAKL